MTRGAVALVAAALAACAAPPTSPAADDARVVREVALANAGFEGALQTSGQPEGWFAVQHASFDSYVFTVDDGVRRSGAKSLRIANVGPEPYGSILQKVRDPALRGRTVRFSAWLRTKDAASSGRGGVLIVQAMRGGAIAAYDHMRSAPVTGTRDWRAYAVTLAVPDDADEVQIGAMLVGPGTLWFDDAKLEVLAR